MYYIQVVVESATNDPCDQLRYYYYTILELANKLRVRKIVAIWSTVRLGVVKAVIPVPHVSVCSKKNQSTPISYT